MYIKDKKDKNVNLNILIIAPLFAPYSGVGALRMVSLAKYLSNHHRITVATFSKKHIEKFYANDIKADVLEKINYIYFDPPTGRFSPVYYFKYRKKLLEALVTYKDIANFDIALLTSGPLEPHGVMKQLSKKFGIKYIIDFRDLDILDPYTPKPDTLFKKLKLSVMNCFFYFFEKQSVKHACHIVVTHERHKEIVSDNYEIDKNEISVILNGFNYLNDSKVTNNFFNLNKYNNVLKIGYLGKMVEYDYNRTVTLLKAVDSFNRKYTSAIILHLGSGSDSIKKIISEFNLNPNIYENFGTMEYTEALSFFKNVDLFASVHNQPNGYGTKIFDYIYLNKPVIAVSPRNIVLSDFVLGFENGFVCNTEKEIIDSLLKIVSENKYYLTESDNIHKYSRDEQNKKYEELLIKESTKN